MTSPKPTRQQIVDAFKHTSMSHHTRQFIADRLIEAGYAEEPRAEGWYWIKLGAGCRWKMARFHNIGWWLVEDGEVLQVPFAIHPSGRITPPEDQ